MVFLAGRTAQCARAAQLTLVPSRTAMSRTRCREAVVGSVLAVNVTKMGRTSTTAVGPLNRLPQRRVPGLGDSPVGEADRCPGSVGGGHRRGCGPPIAGIE